MALPLMQKATAVWLVENTTLTFRQIAEFTGLHELEVNGIADGEVAQGIKGFDPIANRQLTAEEIRRGEADPRLQARLFHNPAAEGEEKRKGPRYTPLSKRQDRPAAIAWLVKFHPELPTARSPSWSAPPSRPSSRSATAATGTSPTSRRSTRWRSACPSSPSSTPPSRRRSGVQPPRAG